MGKPLGVGIMIHIKESLTDILSRRAIDSDIERNAVPHELHSYLDRLEKLVRPESFGEWTFVKRGLNRFGEEVRQYYCTQEDVRFTLSRAIGSGAGETTPRIELQLQFLNQGGEVALDLPLTNSRLWQAIASRRQ